MIKLNLDKNSFLLLACIAVILLALVSYYFSLTNPVRQTYVDSQTVRLEQQSESIETESIKDDLEDTELEDLDSELEDIDQELDYSL